MRSADGSPLTTLPMKLSSSIAARPVCASELPTSPNLKGLMPSNFSSFSPFLSAERTYSNSSMSFVFAAVRVRLPLSQVSKSANSSLGERYGCASPSPLVCVASTSLSQLTSGCIPLVDWLARETIDQREHPAIRQIAIVRNGQHAAAGLPFIGFHPFPQVARIIAADRLHGYVRLDLLGLVAVVAEDDVAVEVVAVGVGGPFITDEGGEASWRIMLFGRCDVVEPRRRIARVPWQIDERL